MPASQRVRLPLKRPPLRPRNRLSVMLLVRPLAGLLPRWQLTKPAGRAQHEAADHCEPDAPGGEQMTTGGSVTSEVLSQDDFGVA